MKAKVVSLRGIGGSGKSYMVRQIMTRYSKREEHRLPGRRHAVGYWLSESPTNLDPLFIAGHYGKSREEDSVFWDTRELHDLVVTAFRAGWSCLYETRSRNDGWERSRRFLSKDQLFPIILDHPLKDSIDSIRDIGGRISVEATRRHFKKILEAGNEMSSLGYEVFRGGRDACLVRVAELLT